MTDPQRTHVPITVVTLTDADVHWTFDNGGLPRVRVATRPDGTWGRSIDLDPFPCYPHDPALVRRTAARVAAAFPLRWPVTYYVLPLEEPRRTNGGQYDDLDHWGEKDARGRTPLQTFIVLPAKRIPPHPGVTRYLAAHEYGHSVEAAIAWERWDNTGNRQNDYGAVQRELQCEYVALRGLDGAHTQAGGGRWHLSVQEILACDFRILVAGIEPEYWPHPGIPRPEEVPALREWWETQRDEYGRALVDTAAAVAAGAAA